MVEEEEWGDHFLHQVILKWRRDSIRIQKSREKVLSDIMLTSAVSP